MLRSLLAWSLALASVAVLPAQERRSRIDVQHYVITAEINPDTQSVSAVAAVRFAALEDGISSAVFELNNALNASKVTDSTGRPLSAARVPQEFSIRVSLPEPLNKGQSATVTFHYEGKLAGAEESPVPGIRFAAIHPEYSYLLYPSRWFPVSGYTSDRYTYEAKITVPAGYSVLASGIGKSEPSGAGKVTYSFSSLRPAFPGQHRGRKGGAGPCGLGGRYHQPLLPWRGGSNRRELMARKPAAS